MNIKIPEGWEIRKLGEIAEIVGGGTPSTKNPKYWNGNISWITPKDLSNFRYRYIYRGSKNITELGLKKSSAKLLPRGTVLLSSRAPIGYVAIAGKELATNQGFRSFIIKEKNKLNNEFLYYWLKLNKPKLESIASGSTFKEVSGSALKQLEIFLPPIPEQEKIADILGSIDDQIENLMEQNKTLEEIAKTIFKRWFIDFEFPNEEGKPYKSSGGEFIDSELGKIPKGWRVGTFGELIKDTIGGDWGKETVKGKFNKKVYAIRGTDFKNLDIGLYDNLPIRYIKSSSLEKRKLKEGELLIELSGGTKGQPTGRIFYVSKSIIENSTYPLVFSNFCRKLIVNKSARPEFIYFYWKYLYSKGVMANYQTESTGISNFQLKSFLKTFKIYIPPKELQNKFSNFAKNIMNKKQNNQIQTLTQLRDTLLPKLITGQIRVKV
ncbi:restriction endonuclease subunit S [Persephonella sp.]|uniref:restriction endonuclease subunit S n=1 Tax=Persephonella sp. TaxID=2060922 RepID=UPI002612A978|nr:restriction endonuclease subunit S [Persephonella sp.]